MRQDRPPCKFTGTRREQGLVDNAPLLPFGLGENILSLALEHESTQFQQSGAIVFGDPNQKQEMDVNSAVAEFQGRSLDRLTWIISARVDDNSDFDDAFNGRLSLAYDLSASTTLRGSVGTGQKNPTFTERFGFFPGQFIVP